MTNRNIGILDLLLMITKKKKYIIIFTLIMSIIAVTISLIIPEKWTSTAVILSMSDSNNLSGAGSIIEGLGLGGGSSIRSITYKNTAILKSRKFSEEIIKKFKLIDYFEITEEDSVKAMDLAVLSISQELLNIYINDENNFMSIQITTKDKQLSKDIADHYVKMIMDYQQYSKNNVGRQKRILLESRINEIQGSMKDLMSQMMKYQNDYNIIDIENQAKESVLKYGEIMSQYFMLDLEGKYLSTQYDENNTKIKDIKKKKETISALLKNMEQRNTQLNYFIPLNSINSKVYTIKEIVFTIELYKKILEAIYPQYEFSKLEEVDNMDKIEIIDYPRIPGFRSSPKRALICAITFIFSLFFSAMSVLVYQIISDEQKSKLFSVWKNLYK